MSNPHPKLENLAPPWPKGTTGNAGGRPKKRVLSDSYDEVLRSELPTRERLALGLPPGTLWCEAIALSRARQALSTTRSGAVESSREMREAVEGKSVQRFELNGPPEGFQVSFTFEKFEKLPEKIIDVSAEPPEQAKLEESADTSKPAES